jgi:tetratricopeptide (TPR) repeat protein
LLEASKLHCIYKATKIKSINIVKLKKIRFIWILFPGLLLFCLVGILGFRRYRESLALRQAQGFAAHGDYRSASLSARRLLRLNPANIEGCRLMGQLAEAMDPREAVEWYQRIATLQPSTENKLELASKALRLQQPPYELAAQTLEELAGNAANRVSYCVLAAELALRLGKGTEAERWFEAVRQLQPTNELHVLNLSMLRLHSTNGTVACDARTTLHRFRTNTAYAVLALRALVTEAITRHDLNAAESLSGELLTQSSALLEDQLRHLEILRERGSPQTERFLTSIQKQAITNAAGTSVVLNWMAEHGQAREAITWLTNASPTVGETPSVRLAAVECFSALNDWLAAEKLLNERKWGPLEPMRLGFLSHAAAERHDTLAADLHWRLAVNQSQKRLGSLIWLAAKAQEWGRESCREEVLWETAEQFPNQSWAQLELLRAAQLGGRTRDLHRLYASMAKVSPKDPGIQNNFAATGLLLNIDLQKSCEIASDLFRQHPTEPVIASTYAYALHVQNRTAKGLSVLDQFSEECLTNPPVALYYGVLLRADGQTDRAGKYLKLAQSAALLPEERGLLERSMKAR